MRHFHARSVAAASSWGQAGSFQCCKVKVAGLGWAHYLTTKVAPARSAVRDILRAGAGHLPSKSQLPPSIVY